MRRLAILMALATAIAGCSGSGDTVLVDAIDDISAHSVDGKLDVQEVDQTRAIDLRDPGFDVIDLTFDVVPEELVAQCQPGEGCFLDPCEANDDCLSGWCVEHMGAGVCTQTCSEECPPGWSCKPVGAAEPDLLYVCVSNHANLCRPCGSGDNCKSVAGAEDVCLDYGDEGSFCGGACTVDADCPWGFSCGETSTVDGIAIKQCVADAGVCPCTDKSIALALWTPCSVANDVGECMGKRVCTDDGLTACDAATPLAETCNGLDDNCDGDVDEGTCDDGNPCTEDSCLGEEGCHHAALTQGECLDNDACTIGDHCEVGVCVGTPIDCDDDNPCTDDECDGLGGCQYANNVAPCDDEDPCTVGDQCNEGECGGFAVACDCLSDSDCQPLEDGDLCNGTLVCDTSALPYQCVVDPGTVVSCPAPDGIDAQCLAASCAPDTGECGFVAANEGLACDDGNACTVGDSCVDGTCTAGVDANCADNNPCTDDSCDPQAGCLHENGDNACDDGNLCTVGESCVDGACTATETLDCNDDNICTDDACLPASGCTHTVNTVPCDDGNPCTLNDHCQDGACVSGPEQTCDDGNVCTADSCGDDGKCLFVPTDGACDDGNACTLGDSCQAGKCQSANLLNCNDDDVCTDDACAPATGCVHTLNQAPCDDDDICTFGDHCNLGECISQGILTCNDNNPCTDDSCQPDVGCTFTPNNQPCDDGEVCTSDDACSLGVCKPGAPLICDDENPCTTDSCQPGQGCVYNPNDLPCDDGDACTESEFCAGGQCGGGLAIDCNDGNVCTDDSCHVATGCIYAANAATCDDGNECTTDDTCTESACVGGPALLCDDNNPCTDDACDSDSGCVAPPVADNTPCGEGLVCIAGDCVPDCESGSQTFDYTGSVQTFVVPNCGTTLTVDAFGAQGGDSFNHNASKGGKGGRVQSKIEMPAGATLYIYVGQKPTERDGGFNGGGDGVKDPGQPTWIGAGGGGATDIRLDGQSLGDRVLVAAGGGGACPNTPTDHGGVGGGLTGGTGNSNSSGSEGKGGTQSAGGAGGTRSGYLPGQKGSAGQGGTAGSNTAGGGGGAGWYGGGGGSWGSGGGGSSWVKAGISSNVSHTSGVNTGHGQITLSW